MDKLVFGVALLIILASWVTIGYVVLHFVTKLW